VNESSQVESDMGWQSSPHYRSIYKIFNPFPHLPINLAHHYHAPTKSTWLPITAPPHKFCSPLPHHPMNLVFYYSVITSLAWKITLHNKKLFVEYFSNLNEKCSSYLNYFSIYFSSAIILWLLIHYHASNFIYNICITVTAVNRIRCFPLPR